MSRFPAKPPASPLAADLLRWYDSGHRDLPWRRTPDPYRIWVSEIMLQQTQVETVIPYYERFLQRFPTLADLARAPLEEVLKHWVGLGYYSRARYLHAAVREVQARYGGRVPDRPEVLLALPGVGDYTAGALLSIAYNRPVPAVDGNVLRVMARVLGLRDDIARPATHRIIVRRLESLIPAERAGVFNQALMELGARVCTPQYPHCPLCPLRDHCTAYRQGNQAQIPVKTGSPRSRELTVVAAAVERQRRLLIVRRPPGGLYGGLWELPSIEAAAGADPVEVLKEFLARQFGLHAAGLEPLIRFTHTLSHRRMDVHAFRCRCRAGSVAETADRRWITRQQVAEFPFARLQQRILDSLLAAAP